MSNRIVALLSLVIFFWSIVGAYYYFFILNKWELNIYANVGEYSLEMYNHTLKTTTQTFCENSTCELIELPPFTYTVTVKKDGYKDVTQYVTILARDLVEMTVTFEKQLQVQAVAVEEPLVLNREKTEREEIEEQIRSDAYSVFDVEGKWFFYFVQNPDSTLTLWQRYQAQDRQYLNFQNMPASKLFLDRIYQTDAEIFIKHGDDLYIFDIFSGTSQRVFFPQSVQYIKKSEAGIYHFVTGKGTFLYDSISGDEPQFFVLFRDFIPYEDGYLWVIFENETQKKKNYQIEQNGNLVVRYSPQEKEIRIIEEVALSVDKIVYEWEKIFFYTANGEKYEVDNIE